MLSFFMSTITNIDYYKCYYLHAPFHVLTVIIAYRRNILNDQENSDDLRTDNHGVDF